jgi:hypothetical protein
MWINILWLHLKVTCNSVYCVFVLKLEIGLSDVAISVDEFVYR